MELNGKTAFITGGGGGIGGGIAAAFIERGMRVVLADIDLARAQEVAAELGQNAKAVALDVTCTDSWAKAVAEAQEAFGAIDVLCNNAGISTSFKSLLETDEAEFERVIAINLRGVYLGVRAVAPAMVKRGQGCIVNTASVNALIPHGNFATYSASKFGVLGLSDSLREELAPSGVGVSVLVPGLTRSRMSMSIKDNQQMSDEAFAAIEAGMMDPVWSGRAVANAIEAGAPYIITHPDHRQALADRQAQILAAFGEAAQPGYGQTSGAVGQRT